MSATHTLLQTHRPGAEPLRVLAASGQLGFGIPEQALAHGMERRPHFIGCDMGSIDPGPYYLGSGEMAAPAQMVRRDLALVLRAARQADIPLIIGSAGTAGAAPQLQATVELLRDIAREERLDFRLSTVASDVPAELVLQAMTEDRLTAIGPMPVPQPHEVLACTHIVGQCGVETLQSALRKLPDVLVAGRCCDTSIFAALPIMLGYPAGLSLHMAKIVECTSLCCQPSGRDAMLAEMTLTDFTLESMNPQAHATPASVAAHALYEQSDPFTVEEPSGTVLLQQAHYEALDAHRTRVSGAGFAPRAKPSLKLEGSARVGARVVLLAGVADPLLLGRLTQVLSEVEGRVRGLVAGDWTLHSHCYGQGAVRPLPVDQRSAHEAGLVLEFMADSRELARTAAGVFKQNLLHFSYPGRLSTGGNLAFAFTPSELDANDAYRFVLYHVIQDAPMEAIFRIESVDIQGSVASLH